VEVVSKGEEIKGIVFPFATACDAFVKKDWVQFAASSISFIDGVLVKASKTSIGRKPGDDIGKAVDSFIATIDDKGIQESVRLAVDVLTHPEKHRNFEETSDGDGPKFGKKDTLRKIKAGLEKLDGMSGPEVDGARAILTAAKQVVHLKLNRARVAKTIGCVSKAVSIAVGVTTAVGSCGASLVPTAVKVAVSSLDSVSGIAQAAIGKTYEREMQQTEGILDGDRAQLEARGIRLAPDALLSLRECNGLAIDVLTHPEKSTDFEAPEDTNFGTFGKKDTRQFLHTALDRFDEWTQDVTDPDVQKELAKVRQDIQTAHDVVSSKLNKARAIKGLKISGAVLATTASVIACVATFGAAAPAIPVAISAGVGALGTVVRDGKVAYELLSSKHKHQ
jgi:hypothetical protein